MPDNFTNARTYFDVTFPSSGDGFSISGMRNSLSGLGFLDVIPLQPRAHNPANMSILIRGRDTSSFYNPVYYGDGDQRVSFNSGDTSAMVAPVSNPRIDIVYLTPSGDLRIATGTEAVSPTLPSLSPSGDSRFPICAVWHRVGETKIVNFESKDASTGDGYIYQDLRPWMRTAGAGASKVTSITAPKSISGDNTIGTDAGAAHADHIHQGVHAIRKVGSSELYGDIEFAGLSITQGGNRLTFSNVSGDIFAGALINKYQFGSGDFMSGTTAMPYDGTPPQYGEGDTYLRGIIPPASANSVFLVMVELFSSLSTVGASTSSMALYWNKNLIMVSASDTSNYTKALTINTLVKPGITGNITFEVQAATGAGTTYVNGNLSAAQLFNRNLCSTLTILEFSG